MDNEELRTINHLVGSGQLADAKARGLDYSRRNPSDIDALYMTVMLCLEVGDLQAAVHNIFRLLDLRPQDAEAYFHLGRAYTVKRDFAKAAACFHKAIELAPALAEAYAALGYVLLSQCKITESEAATRKAISLTVDYENSHMHLAALPRPTSSFARSYSNLLFTLSYNVMYTPQRLLAEHKEYDRRLGGKIRARAFTRVREGSPDRRLRIGYVSPDFRKHPVSYFFEPLLDAHDHTEVEVYCYAEVKTPDEVTARLKARTDHWRSTVDLSDETVAQQVDEDQIDILVDLAGHTANNRLGVFAYKPAPVQATYLGYFTTTGLDAMDYWLSDSVLTPLDTVECTTEKIWRLPRCCLAYNPPAGIPEVAVRPRRAPIVFGSFNRWLKTSDEAVALWSAVLRAVPGSRLLLKTNDLSDQTVRTGVRAHFAAYGIEEERLDLRGKTPDVAAHFEQYSEMDIALDTIPRTGGTTTADALWMGVPVVTLAGRRFIERLSATMLSAVGLDELIATDSRDYIAKAVGLAKDPERRMRLRAGLRSRMAGSELCDGRGLAAALEAAYREMWRRYLGRET